MFTYIVSGTKRTGTSMVMECVEKGGLEIVWDESRDEAIRLEQPRNPNAHFYELEPPRQMWLPMTGFDDVCIKSMGSACLGRGGGPFKVVYMTRDRHEQRQSVKFACGEVTDEKKQVYLDDTFLGRFRESDQVDSLTVLDYGEVIKNPLKSFCALRNDGWPIDPVKASEGVDPKLKHY